MLNLNLFTANSFGNKQKARFFAETGTLLSAGVDLHTILNIATSSNKDNKNELLYKEIAQQVINGTSMSEAMSVSNKFNNFDYYSVLIGENTGEISSVFVRLGEYYNKKIERQRKIKGAMSYPIIVLLTTIGAIWFMLKFVVPMFAQTLIKFGGELPALTRIIINLSEGVTSFSIGSLIIVGIMLLIWKRNRHKETVQKSLSTLLLKTPYLGKYVYKANMLEFVMGMNLLLNSKVNIVESIDMARKISSFYPLTKSLERIKGDIMKGDFFYRSMEKQHFFEASMITMVKIGEEVNQLDRIFLQLSKQYENELEYQSTVFMSILEPAIILVLALVVGVILVAMYLPMFKIGTLVH